ncbi:DNA repair protein RAD51 4, partial [Tetrabaena socialis]
MRWNELGSVLPQAALHQLANTFPSVESFLVSRSKLQGVHGSIQAGGGTHHADASALYDDAAAESVAAACLAPAWRTGLQLQLLLQRDVKLLPIGCLSIDHLLGGGLRQGTLTEWAGETASGKTQLCLLAAANTASMGLHVLYLDTTGSFAPERVLQFAEASAKADACTGNGPAWDEARRDDLAKRVLSHISVLRPATAAALLALLDRLAAALDAGQGQQGPDLGGAQAAAPGQAALMTGPSLLVVDSVSAVLSTILGNNQHTQGTALLMAAGRLLKQLAERNIAVLVSNHVTSAGTSSRAAGGGEGGGMGDRGVNAAVTVGVAGLRPALGEQWRPQPHMRIQLSIDEAHPQLSGMRLATLTASPLQ